MANTIRLKRGLSSNVTSASLIEGELALTTDTLELYTNNGTENVKLTQKGESGVYVGSERPTDDSVIWIDPTGTANKGYTTLGFNTYAIWADSSTSYSRDESLIEINKAYRDYLNKQPFMIIAMRNGNDQLCGIFTGFYSNSTTWYSNGSTVTFASTAGSDDTSIETQRTYLTATISEGTITSFNITYNTQSIDYLSTTKDYTTAYTPLYDGSPATKKYVDDAVAAGGGGGGSATALSGTTAPTDDIGNVGDIYIMYD